MKLRIALAGLLATIVVLAAPGAAGAKGPSGVTISGPGLERPIELEMGTAQENTRFAELVRGMGVMETLFAPAATRLDATAPAGELGPRYELEVGFYGPDGPDDLLIRQHLYPYADRGAFVYTPPGQRLFGRTADAGWSRADDNLKPILVGAGLPATAPVVAPPEVATAEADGGFGSPGLIAGAVAVALLGAGVLLLGRRRFGWLGRR